MPGSADARASTALPGRTGPPRSPGTSALTHTVRSPLMRNSGAPDITVMPSRAPSSATTPSIGAMHDQARLHLAGRLDRADLLLRHAGEPHALARAVDQRLPCRVPVMRRADRYSSCAATQSGTYSSASGWPLRTGSSGARTKSFSTKPLLRACTTATSRSL